jgi:hypothetical protein
MLTLYTPCTKKPNVLVIGVGMSKELFIARCYNETRHTVIGADFEPHGLPVNGHFSSSLKKFYRLPTPNQNGLESYARALVLVIEHGRVILWVSCSGVTSAIQDGEAGEAVERRTNCKTIQLGSSLTQLLHEKDLFISNTRKRGLTVPITHRVRSVDEAMDFFYPKVMLPSLVIYSEGRIRKHFIMKSVETNDAQRSNMSILDLC